MAESSVYERDVVEWSVVIEEKKSDDSSVLEAAG